MTPRKQRHRAAKKGAPSSKKGGRPSKFTSATRRRILDALRAGSYRVHACRVVGISADTLGVWMRKGDVALTADTPDEYSDFALAVMKAEAEAIMRCMRRIERAGAKHWQADAWFLERRHPEFFGRRTVEVNLRSERDVRAALADILGVSPDQLPEAFPG